MNRYADACGRVYSTAHYDLHFRPGSWAERDIRLIAAEQERCYAAITEALGVTPPFRIQYYLLDTPEEVGQVYGDNEPCNGFASPPDTVFAVYSDKVRCIGMHEDTHLISYVRKRPETAFFREGLAMYMDKVWWGRENEGWVRDFLADGRYLSVPALLDNHFFYAHPDAVTYPIAGAFTRFLAEKLGMRGYLEQVYYAEKEARDAVESALGLPGKEWDGAFSAWLALLTK